jgi:aspartate/methionine/tyrosine aminotransferase
LARSFLVSSTLPIVPRRLAVQQDDGRANPWTPSPAAAFHLDDLRMEHDLLVINDEVYEHLVFDGAQHLPIATFPGMAQRTLSVSGAGKTFSVTGWKIGWVCGPAHLVAAARAA